MTLPRSETLAYAPGDDAGSQRIMRFLLLTTMVLSSLPLAYGALMVVDITFEAGRLVAPPIDDWRDALEVLAYFGFAIGGFLILVAAGRLLFTGGQGSGKLLVAGLGCQAIGALMHGAVMWDWFIRGLNAMKWSVRMSYMGPSLFAPLIIAAALAIFAIFFARRPASPRIAVRLVLIGTLILAAISILEAAITVPALLVTDPTGGPGGRTSPLYDWMRQRPIALGVGGMVAAVAIIGSLLRPRREWPWLLAGGLAIQAVGLGIYWSGWFSASLRRVARYGVSFDSLVGYIFNLLNPTFELCLVAALTIFFAQATVRGAMAPRPY